MKAEARRLNGFQNRCLRQIIGVKPSYISRISNERVLRMSGHRQATRILEDKQLMTLGRVLRLPEGHPMRIVSLMPGTTRPATEQYVRRVGRPCKEWIPEALDLARRRLCRDSQEINFLAQCELSWKKAVAESA